jgi:hypothetical protein
MLLGIVTKFLGPWGSRNRAEEHGALLARGFHKTGMKLFLNSWDRDDFLGPGRQAPSFDLFSDTTENCLSIHEEKIVFGC